MSEVLLLIVGLGLFLAGMGSERLRRTDRDIEKAQRDIERMRELFMDRRIPYGVVEQAENEQASIVKKLIWVDHALDEVRLAMNKQIALYNNVLDRDPLEGDGRDRHHVSKGRS
ncbi:MAG TPA: hypothetical protein VJK02_13705 [Anaerolineales bacterium]|nr:hypothetical protein [Anaerolineales bacterium]